MVDLVKMTRSQQLEALRQSMFPDLTTDRAVISAGVAKSIVRCIDDHADSNQPAEKQLCWASAETIARETGWSVRTTRRAIQALVDAGAILSTERPGKTAILRINWMWISSLTPDTMSPLTPCHPCHPVTTPLTPCPGTPDTMSPETKGKRKGNEKSVPRFTPEDRQTAEWFWERVQEVTGTDSKPPNFDRWADSIRKIREDGQTPRTHADVRSALSTAHADSFWAKNILSPDKLREKWTAISALRKKQTTVDPSHKPWRGSHVQH